MSSGCDDRAMRSFTRSLFGHAAPFEPSVEPPKPKGYSHREGSVVETTRREPVRDFVADLFGVDENARGLNSDPW